MLGVEREDALGAERPVLRGVATDYEVVALVDDFVLSCGKVRQVRHG